jgi:hypothetical protein
MYAATSRQAFPYLFGDEGQERRRHTTEGLQHCVQRVERFLVSSVPETITAPPHIPVGEHVAEITKSLCRKGAVELIKMLGYLFQDFTSLGQDVAIEFVL